MKGREPLGIQERNGLRELEIKEQDMVLELQEKEMSDREKVLREREEKMGL